MAESLENTDDPPNKIQKTNSSSLAAALSNLKKSEFFEKSEKELLEAAKAGPSKSSGNNALLVNPKQRGNPLLKFVINVPWEYSEIVPDYVMGRTACALFLSLRYHQLNPDYLHERLKGLGKSYNLRVLLVQIDVPEPHHALKHLTRICLLADLTLILAWSAEEAGKIIETYKSFENKPPDMIMDRSDTAPQQKITSALTTVRSVNKTDAMTLLNTFGTFADIVKASEYKLGLCPGFGSQKAHRLHKTLHEPFLKIDNPTVEKNTLRTQT